MLGKKVAVLERQVAELRAALDSLKPDVATLKRRATHQTDYGANMQPAIDQLVAQAIPKLDDFLRTDVKPALIAHFADADVADGIYEQMDDDAVATALAPILISKLADPEFRAEFMTALATAIYEDENLDLDELQAALAEVIAERLQVTITAPAT